MKSSVYYILYHSGVGIREIGRRLHRSVSTISREIHRNKTGCYYVAVTAHNKAHRRCRRNPRKLFNDKRLRRIVLSGLRKQWSPAQISAKLKADHPDEASMRVCAETIYTYLYVLPRAVYARSCYVICGNIASIGGQGAGAATVVARSRR